MKTFAILSVASMLSVAVIAGCNDEEQSAAPASAAAPAATGAAGAALPASLVVGEAPANAQDLVAVKKNAKDGDAVVIRGTIGGREEPIAKGRAIMTVLDPSVTTCDTMPGDACKAPWDACCEPSEKIAANSATVQVVDAQGKPLAASLESIAGLKPLSKVTVAGVARRPAGSDVLIVEANKIHVTP
jgi:hypothetical protein